MKTIIIEIDIPDFEEIQAPASWKTDVGVFDNMLDIYAIESTINYFKNNNDRDYLINAHHDIRKLLVKGLLERNAPYGSTLSDNHHLVEAISSLIFGFRNGTGYKIDDYTFTWAEYCKGTKISIPGTNYIYDSVDKLVETAVSNYTRSGHFNSKMFKYKLIEKEA